ncbi:unnamed protein product [Enterobius vermicularis]|uniref:Catechol O-methyltransferase domain-containing protein 1 n=1 Tax=Enterobius vermicularis TaxID=51028 RepID=A0A0N4VEZ7_ENTVE|nr:unnamed protein product [Enterobius vermicularis]
MCSKKIAEFGLAGLDKSFFKNDPVSKYCTELSIKQDPLLKKVSDDTIRNLPFGLMIGAPEVYQLGQNLLRLIRAKKALDIGTFTGASAVAWSLALPSDGQVISMDVSHDAFKQIGEQAIKAREDVAKKITFKLEPALQTLDGLLANGEAGTWDFAFIDADKENYLNYYEKCVELLRPGGVMMVDNVSFCGLAFIFFEYPLIKAIHIVLKKLLYNF